MSGTGVTADTFSCLSPSLFIVTCQSRCYTPTCIIWLSSCFHSHLFSVTSHPIYDFRNWWNCVTLSMLCTLGQTAGLRCGTACGGNQIRVWMCCVVLSLRLMACVYSVSCCCERLRDIIGWNGCRSEAQWRIAVDIEREAQRHQRLSWSLGRSTVCLKVWDKLFIKSMNDMMAHHKRIIVDLQ